MSDFLSQLDPTAVALVIAVLMVPVHILARKFHTNETLIGTIVCIFGALVYTLISGFWGSSVVLGYILNFMQIVAMGIGAWKIISAVSPNGLPSNVTVLDGNGTDNQTNPPAPPANPPVTPTPAPIA